MVLFKIFLFASLVRKWDNTRDITHNLYNSSRRISEGETRQILRQAFRVSDIPIHLTRAPESKQPEVGSINWKLDGSHSLFCILILKL